MCISLVQKKKKKKREKTPPHALSQTKERSKGNHTMLRLVSNRQVHVHVLEVHSCRITTHTGHDLIKS